MKELFDMYQQEFQRQWAEYVALHTKLDEYRGKEIGDKVDEINILLQQIQDKFAMVYPSLQFIVTNYKLCVTAINDYNQFVSDIQAAGAKSTTIVEA